MHGPSGLAKFKKSTFEILDEISKFLGTGASPGLLGTASNHFFQKLFRMGPRPARSVQVLVMASFQTTGATHEKLETMSESETTNHGETTSHVCPHYRAGIKR